MIKRISKLFYLFQRHELETQVKQLNAEKEELRKSGDQLRNDLKKMSAVNEAIKKLACGEASSSQPLRS